MKQKNARYGMKLFMFILFSAMLIIQGSDNSQAVLTKWDRYGATERGSFIQNAGIGYAVNLSVSTGNPTYSSAYSPVIDDLDGDGVNEIIIITVSNEIRLFSGSNFDFVDSYYNAELTPSGQFVTFDFLGSDDPELMLITNTVSSNYSLWAMNWNGTDFNITKEIELPIGDSSHGLNCQAENCYYFSSDDKLYQYNRSHNTATSPIYTHGSNEDCAEYSIPEFWDFDRDGDLDIFAIWGSSCNHVLQLENVGGGSYTWNYDYDLTAEVGAVNNIAMANFDDGQRELVIAQSHLYAHAFTPTSDLSTVHIFKVEDHSSVCSHSFSAIIGTYSPIISSLHTCYSDEGQTSCDVDFDGFNDVWITINWLNAKYNSTFEIMDKDCNIIGSIEMENSDFDISGSNDYDTEDFVKGVYANMDDDTAFEYIYPFGIWNRDGSKLVSLRSTPATTIVEDAYVLVAEVTGDLVNDIIIQIPPLSPKITVFSFNYTNENPYFIGDGVDVDTCIPLCLNETITFYARQGLDYDDEENDDAILGVDCFELGLGNVSWGSLAEDTEVTCTYNTLGSWEVDVYITDESNHPSFTDGETLGIYTALSGCYDAGEWEASCSPFVTDPPEPTEICFTDSGVSVCLTTGITTFLCDACDCSEIPYNKCPNYYPNGTQVEDRYVAKMFDWSQCEDYQDSMWYGACPLFIWTTNTLNAIWEWMFGAFWIFLTLLLVVVVLAIIVKKRTGK